jgi:membrane protease subunit HflK
MKAWNESDPQKPPGGRNPWDRPPAGGTVDLDGLVKDLRRKFAELLGASGGRGAGGGDHDAPGHSPGMRAYLVGLLALLGLWCLLGSPFMVGPAEKAVVTRFGRFDRIADSGLNFRFPWPIENRQLVNTQEFQSFTDHTRMLTQDAALIDINIAVQYRRADPKAFVFNLVDPQQTLGEVSESAIREVIGQSQLDFVLEKGRQEIALRTRQLIQRTLDSYHSGLEVIGVNLQDVNVPEPVAPSQKDAIKAREDKERLRVEAETYSNNILPRARGTAEQQMLDAEAYRQRVVADAEGQGSRFAQLAAAYGKAPGVTRERLYLETMEAVLGNTGKIIVDTKGAGNMIYLPLDKLLEKRADGSKPGTTVPEVTVTPPAAHSEAVDSAADARSRARGNR